MKRGGRKRKKGGRKKRADPSQEAGTPGRTDVAVQPRVEFAGGIDRGEELIDQGEGKQGVEEGGEEEEEEEREDSGTKSPFEFSPVFESPPGRVRKSLVGRGVRGVRGVTGSTC
jgi:hypothetical protein